MTGELTLTGQVLPIGGLKEKALAAQAAGIKRVIAPKLNEQDIDDIPEHLRKDLEFIFVERIEQVLAEALVPEGTGPRAGPTAHARASRSEAREGAHGVPPRTPARAKHRREVKAKRRRSSTRAPIQR